jgi:hypothetical protein
VRTVTALEIPRQSHVVCKGHEGRYRALVELGDDAWKYYFMTRKQLRFWRKLAARERSLIARRSEEGCLLCTLDAAVAHMERFEEGLYSALMTSLLVQS